MISTMSRRSVLGLLAAVTGGGLLAGCGDSGAGGGGEVDFWSYYEAAGRAATFPKLVETYATANPEVRVNLNLAPQNYNTVVRTAMLSGDRPDLIGVPQYLMRDFGSAGLLTDLEPLINESGLADLLFPAAVEAGRIDGTLYGLADALRFGMWFYAPGGFDDLGMAQPTTYDELGALADAARAKNRIPIMLGLKDLSAASNSFQVVAPAFIGLTDILAASAAKDYTAQPFVDALTAYRTMVDDGIMDTTDTGVTAADAQALLAGGQVVMYPSASYSIGTLLGLSPDISAFDEPVALTTDPVVTYWGGAGQMYSLPDGAPAHDAARALLSWWMQPDQLRVQVAESGLVSSVGEANDAIPPDSLARFAADRLDKVEDEGLFYNNYVPTAEAEAWGRAIQEVVSKAKTPEQAIETTVQASFR